MPPQPYVNGTWNDSDVQKAIEKHLKSLEIWATKPKQWPIH
jgi:hypothetical protein